MRTNIIKRLTLTLVALTALTTGVRGQMETEVLTYSGEYTFTGTHFSATGNPVVGYNGLRIGPDNTIIISSIDGCVINQVSLTIGDGAGYASTITTTAGTLEGSNIININDTTLEISSTANSGCWIIGITVSYTPKWAMARYTDGTTAKMTMGADDVTVGYELVRDMSYQVAFNLAVDSLRLAFDSEIGEYSFADYPNAEDVFSQFIVVDNITGTPDTLTSDDYKLSAYQAQDGQPTGNTVDHLWPGQYVLVATGKGNYDGTVVSPVVTFYESYNLVVKPTNTFSADKLERVTVDGQALTLNANGKAVCAGVSPDSQVLLKAKRGYVYESVEVTDPLIVNPHVGQLIGSDGKNYASTNDIPMDVDPAAVIVYVDPNGNGLAMAMNEMMDRMNRADAIEACSNKTAPEDLSWHLPSRDELVKIFTNDEGRVIINDMNNILIMAGADSWQSGTDYWVIDEGDLYFQAIKITDRGIVLADMDLTDLSNVRAVLAF